MTQPESSVPRRGRWLKRLAWAAAILVVLVVALYFIVTSSAFLKGCILPQISRSINAEVSISAAEISPFSHIVLYDLKVTPRGAAPILSATTVTARYNLRAILGGHILVDEVSIDSPNLTLIENADGTSNLTPLQSSEKTSTPPKPAPPAKASAPPALDIHSVRLANATIRHVRNFKDGSHDAVELTHVTITVANIKNGMAGQLDFSTSIGAENPAGTLQATLNGSLRFDLEQDLRPGAVRGGVSLDIDQGTGDFASLARLGAKLDCDVTPTEIKGLTLAFTKGGVSQGNLLVNGPFDGVKMEGKLKVEVHAIDRQVLNLVGAASGIDFGTTTINTSNEIELTKGGTMITAAGSMDVAHLQMIRQKQSSPTLDLRCEYNVAVDQQARLVIVKTLNLIGKQDQRRLLKIDLSDPLTVVWGNHSNAVGDSTLTLALTELNLADWKPLGGDTIPAGLANLKLKVLSQRGGQQLTFESDASLEHFSTRVGNDQLTPLDVRLRMRGQIAELRKINLDEYHLEVTEKKQPLLTVTASGTMDQQTQDADMQVKITAALARLAALLPQAGFTCRSGQLEVTSHITTKGPTQAVDGKLALTDFSGGVDAYAFDKFGVTLDFDLLMKERQLVLHKIAGQLHEGPNAGGRFAIAGAYQLDQKTGQFDVKLADFKENDLRPFLQPSLGDKKLVSVTFNTAVSAGITATGDASVKGDVHVANLVVQDPANRTHAPTLEARLQMDVSANHQVVTLRQFQLALTPTARANNEVQLTGLVDCTKSNAITGNLKLASTGLDLTSYYDLFTGANQPSDTTAAPEPAKTPAPAPQPAAAVEAKEPAAVVLPFHEFTFSTAIDRCYLREVDITNFLATVKLDGGHVVLKPFQLGLNGAPINAAIDMDLGVPGYKYDVTFNADKVPLAPLVDSFSPAYSDDAHGMLLANLQVKGAGIKGRNLREHLTGKTSVVVTNADIKITGTGIVKQILTAISFALGAPEVLTAPLDYADLKLKFSNGKIEDSFSVRSAAILADSSGTIPIADVLMDSPLNQHINVFLSKQLAHRLHPNTPTEGYMKMGPLVGLEGTLGNVKVETIASETVKTVTTVVGKTANTVKSSISKFFSGSSNTNSNSSSSRPKHSDE